MLCYYCLLLWSSESGHSKLEKDSTSTRAMTYLSVCQDMVGYIPTIDAPATEMATGYEILNQSNLMMAQLHLERRGHGPSAVCKRYRVCVEAHIQVCEHHPSDGHFPHHHDLTRHHRKTVPRCWPARHLHWIGNNCRGFSIWRVGRNNVQPGSESSQIHNYMKLYFVSTGKVSCPGWKLTTQTRYTQSVHCLTKSAMHVKKCPKQSLTNCSQVMVWQIRWSYGISSFPTFATTMKTHLPSGCHMLTWLVISYLDWSEPRERAIGNCTCLPSGQWFHDALPMTAWIMRDIYQHTIVRLSTSRPTIHKFTNTSPMEDYLSSLLTIHLVAFQ